MSSVTVYGFSQSTYVQTVMLVCLEKGVDYQLEDIDFGSSSHAALHPFLKMPIADIKGVTLYETLAITTMIDECMHGVSLQPKLLEEKSVMLQWVSAAIDYVYTALVATHFDEQVSQADKTNALAKLIVLLNRQLSEHRYLAGNAVSLADLFVYPMLKFTQAKMNDFDLMLKDQTHLSVWLRLMDERPSAKALYPGKILSGEGLL